MCLWLRLIQMKAERERSRTEMKDLQLQLSEMHDELDRAEKSEAPSAQTELLLKVRRSSVRQEVTNLNR